MRRAEIISAVSNLKDALEQSGHRSVTFGMANDTGYVTDAIEQMLGNIPSECRSDGGGTLSDVIAPASPKKLMMQ